MARPRRVNPALVKHARLAAAHAQNIQELRSAQAVLLPALAQLSLEATAEVLGVGRATVARLQARFRQCREDGPRPARSWGGRRRALMTFEDEAAFLAAWKPLAVQGRLPVITPLRVALEAKVGRRLNASVVYRLLARHRWRKLVSDLAVQQVQPGVRQRGKKRDYLQTWRPS